MTDLSSLKAPTLDTVKTRILPPDRISLEGTITMQEPGKVLASFFRSVHDVAVANKLAELKVDVSGLTFVNSSAIRLFIDWSTWIKAETSHSYRLRFFLKRSVTWQKTSFVALQSLIKEVLVVEYVD